MRLHSHLILNSLTQTPTHTLLSCCASLALHFHLNIALQTVHHNLLLLLLLLPSVVQLSQEQCKKHNTMATTHPEIHDYKKIRYHSVA